MFNEIKSLEIDYSEEPWPLRDSRAIHLVKRMLDRNPKERISAAEVLGKFLSFSFQDCSRANTNIYIWIQKKLQGSRIVLTMFVEGLFPQKKFHCLDYVNIEILFLFCL